MRFGGTQALADLLRRAGACRPAPMSTDAGLLAWITGRSAAVMPPVIGGPGFTMPSGRVRVLPMAPRRPGNWILLAGDRWPRIRTRIRVDPGATGNVLVLGNSTSLPSSVLFQGRDNVAIFGDSISWRFDVDVRFSSDRGCLFMGRACSANGTSIIVEGDGCTISIGDDCMFAAGTAVRSSDLHAISDRGSGRWLNPPADVLIEPHVWIGQDALIAKGARVGEGSVIGAKSLVTGRVPPHCITAGVPANVLRENVEWTRERQPVGA